MRHLKTSITYKSDSLNIVNGGAVRKTHVYSDVRAKAQKTRENVSLHLQLDISATNSEKW